MYRIRGTCRRHAPIDNGCSARAARRQPGAPLCRPSPRPTTGHRGRSSRCERAPRIRALTGACTCSDQHAPACTVEPHANPQRRTGARSGDCRGGTGCTGSARPAARRPRPAPARPPTRTTTIALRAAHVRTPARVRSRGDAPAATGCRATTRPSRFGDTTVPAADAASCGALVPHELRKSTHVCGGRGRPEMGSDTDWQQQGGGARQGEIVTGTLRSRRRPSACAPRAKAGQGTARAQRTGAYHATLMRTHGRMSPGCALGSRTRRTQASSRCTRAVVRSNAQRLLASAHLSSMKSGLASSPFCPTCGSLLSGEIWAHRHVHTFSHMHTQIHQRTHIRLMRC